MVLVSYVCRVQNAVPLLSGVFSFVDVCDEGSGYELNKTTAERTCQTDGTYSPEVPSHVVC